MSLARRVSAGGAVWLVLALTLPERGMMGEIDRLLLLGLLVTTPLALELASEADEPAAARSIRLALLPAALLSAASFFLRPGLRAALFTVGWMAVCAAASLPALAAAGRALAARRVPGPDQLCLLAARLYLPVGAGWLFVSRLGANPLSFSDAIVLLTAVHFHFAGCAAPVLAGLLARRLLEPPALVSRRLVVAVCLGVVLGTPILAAGITFSRAVETAAGVLLASSMALLGVLQLAALRPLVVSPTARTCLALSSASLLLAMLLGAAYALRDLTGGLHLDIPRMARTHGWLNAAGFALLGLVAWTIEGRGRCSSL